jgi:hypothetical protein
MNTNVRFKKRQQVKLRLNALKARLLRQPLRECASSHPGYFQKFNNPIMITVHFVLFGEKGYMIVLD